MVLMDHDDDKIEEESNEVYFEIEEMLNQKKSIPYDKNVLHLTDVLMMIMDDFLVNNVEYPNKDNKLNLHHKILDFLLKKDIMLYLIHPHDIIMDQNDKDVWINDFQHHSMINFEYVYILFNKNKTEYYFKLNKKLTLK